MIELGLSYGPKTLIPIFNLSEFSVEIEHPKSTKIQPFFIIYLLYLI